MRNIAAANKSEFLITAGLAGIAAGSMSMAVGEYVSVKSQNDIEKSDRDIEIKQLAIDPEKIARQIAAGTLSLVGERIVPTEAGKLVVNELALDLTA